MNHPTPSENLESDRAPTKRSSGWLSVLPSLLTPICFGLALYFLLAWAINKGHIADEMVLRYLTGHAISKVTVGMFLIGAASLFLIAYNIFEQFCAEKTIQLYDLQPTDGSSPVSNQNHAAHGIEEEAERAVEHGEQLLELPAWTQTHYLWNRLVKTLHYIYRTGSVSGVEDEMKYLAELDLDRSHQRYSLARILIWATPMLGFLGTVLGISQALGGISPGPENDFQAMMSGLQSNLYVAFDTTALALTLSMVLMFGQFLVERFEIQLLQLVDQRTRREIADQYDMTMASVANGSFDKIGREVLEATRDDVVRGGLSEALEENVCNLADYLGQAIEKANQSTVFRWEQWQTMLSHNARLMKEHQDQMIEQTKRVHSLVGKMEDSSSYSEALEQQKAAIKATTDMHEVLTQVARELTAQGKQLKKQTAVQAEMVKQSTQWIEKTGDADKTSKREQQRSTQESSKTVPQNQASSKIAIAEAKALKAFAELKQDVGKEAGESPKELAAETSVVPGKRRRDPKKPVMFMRSEEVTAMRNKTATSAVAAVSPIQKRENVLKIHSGGVVEKTARSPRSAPMIIKPRKSPFLGKESAARPAEHRKPQGRISVDALKQMLKKNASKSNQQVVMPDSKTMRDRAQFRENERIVNAAEIKAAPGSKKAA
jgi:biopolymer transport protein ExbB/TolQ